MITLSISPMMFFLLLLILIVASYLLGNNNGWRSHKESVNSELRDYQWLRENYLTKQGSVLMSDDHYINYYLMSFDAGKTWYATDHSNEQVKILGPVEEIHPGLLDRINAFAALSDYVNKNGPITFANPKEVTLLQNAGFTVEKK